ncbi:ribonuclease HIII [Gracilibacillus sp. S3-1-1]|uniref:Ribonuclease HIII n=1 Tax=Gracilibacillus pellucidus TaxID=3095368 RepID=A0ACC6M6T5_9BACI|nr:ribonuclease HIII [Gracilibacillus sp. S3-1-1]MDX8046649.1 ribonuclease HIII [Gracilibacillus sp. S3-1-1]
MSNVVLQFPKNELAKVKSYYEQYITKIPANSLFLAKVNNVTVTAYKSGKVMFQGDRAQQEAAKWNKKATNNPNSNRSNNTVNAHDYQPPKTIFTQAHIGTDEAGTGDYFGPITVSAVFVPDDKLDALKALGIADSKTLTDTDITRLAKDLVKEKIPYTLLTLDNSKYNRLQKKGWNQGKMKAMLHQHAIQKLLAKIENVPNNGILIDQFCQPSSFIKHIGQEGLKLERNTYFMTKAESYSIPVAAASIIARAKFVKEMDKLSAQYGFTVPKGASAKVDEAAAYFIKKNGLDELDKVAKMHFANTDKALRLVK